MNVTETCGGVPGILAGARIKSPTGIKLSSTSDPVEYSRQYEARRDRPLVMLSAAKHLGAPRNRHSLHAGKARFA